MPAGHLVQGQLEWVALDHVQASFEYLQGGRVHHPSGQRASAQSPSRWTRVSWCSEGTWCVSICARRLSSCRWAPLKSAWLCCLCILPSGVCTRWSTFPEPSLLQAKQSHLSQPLVVWEMLQCSLWPFGGLCPVAPCLPSTGQRRTRPSTPGVAPPELSRGKGSPPSTCWQRSS